MSTLEVFAGTWNLGGQGEQCSDDLEAWAARAQQESPSCNIYVFGFQEVVDIKTESHLWYPSQAYLGVVEAIDRGLGKGYNLIACHGLSQMFIIVFADSVVQANIREATTSDVACGHLNILGNKGATTVKLTFNDGEEMFIVNCHLAAHKHNTAMRNANFQRIMQSLDAQTKLAACSIIWLGDLNYRLDLPNEDVRRVLATTPPDLGSILKECQLIKAMDSNEAFGRFREIPIEFMPTYKYDMRSTVYDSSRKQRTPSWTDRILYKGFESKLRNLKATNYKAWGAYLSSDHRPVSCMLSIEVHSEAWRETASDALVEAGTDKRFAKSAALESGPTLLLVRAGELLVVAILAVALFSSTSGAR